MKRLDLVGKKFGKLIVLEFSHVKKFTYWKCKCDCGKYLTTAGYSLVRGQVKSCGCLHLGVNRTHGMGRTKIYQIWYNMKARCYNKLSDRYYCYGSRGITICDRWLKFENFRDDMLASYNEHCEKYGKKDTTIERKNNNGNYCPENCLFATWSEQYNNKSTNHLLTLNGKTLNIKQWSKELGISYSTLQTRVTNLHWSDEEALTIPFSKKIKSS